LHADKAPSANGNPEMSAMSMTSGRRTGRKHEPLTEDDAVSAVFTTWFTLFTTVVTAIKKPKFLPNAFAVGRNSSIILLTVICRF